MQEQAPNTVLVGRFEDLIARGLRGLIDDDLSLTLVATDIAQERLPVVLAVHRPIRSKCRTQAPSCTWAAPAMTGCTRSPRAPRPWTGRSKDCPRRCLSRCSAKLPTRS